MSSRVTNDDSQDVIDPLRNVRLALSSTESEDLILDMHEAYTDANLPLESQFSSFSSEKVVSENQVISVEEVYRSSNGKRDRLH